jgi:predicted RNA-binding protein with PIN domain
MVGLGKLMFYLIDGYNLALVAGLVRRLDGPGNAQRARERLLSWLSNHLDDEQRARTTVVFDARRSTADQKELVVNAMRVLFAADHDDADSLIEELIARHSAPRRLIVISNDQRIQTAARRRRAIASRSDDWFERTGSVVAKPERADRPDESPRPEERDRLIAEFDTEQVQEWIAEDRRANRGIPLPKPSRRHR